MAPPSWAYQVDMFDPPPDEELVCSICCGIFCDPVRSPCNHVYCRNCIHKWLEDNRNCPICRKRTCQGDIKEVVPLINNMIMKLVMKCHNLERGCKEKFSLEACEAHMKECSFEVIRCANRPCKKMLLRKDIKDHELGDCSHRGITCKKCGLKIPIKGSAPQKHECIKALRQRLKYSLKVIKLKKQKIKDLRKENRTLKENAATSSISNVAENMIDFFLPSDFDISFSSTSSDSFLSGSEAGGESVREPNPADIFRGLQQRLNRRNSSVADETQDLSEELSPSFPPFVPLDDATTSRRPPKRRMPILLEDSSSDDASNEAAAAFPSPKRSWSQICPRCPYDDLTTFPGTTADPSLVATTSAATNGSYPDENETSVTVEDTMPSEAENESDSVEIPQPSRDGYITSSDELSLIELDSDE